MRQCTLKYVMPAMSMILCLAGVSVFAAKPPPLDEHQAMEVLFANLQVELPAGQGCVSAEATTIIKFIQTTLAYLAQEQGRGTWSRVDYARVKLNDEVNQNLMAFYSDATKFPASVRETLANMEKGRVLYQYTLWWGHTEGENVWSRGIQFLVYESDGSPVEGSFRCLSTP